MNQRITYIIASLMFVLTVTAQKQYRTSELERLATALPIDVNQLPEGYSHPIANGQQLTIHQEQGIIDHIGLQLFSTEIRNMSQSPIFDFLERYFLMLKYPPTVKSTANMLRDDQFRFLKGTISDVDNLHVTDDFSFNNNNHRYTATWSRKGKELLSVSFPVEYELISGENKIEAENNLLGDIKKVKISNTSASLPNPQDKGNNYINDCFSNRLYFQNGQLVSSSLHPAETLANLMLTMQAQGQYDMKFTQISYGFKKREFQVPLRQWIAYCENMGCELYFGIESMNDHGDINAVVLAVNQEENYNHVLTVSTNTDILSTQEGTIDARLYPYVPTHNVMNMFANYRKSNPKTFVSK